MPTARELLEQADALMRRNRARDSAQRAPAPAAAPDIPVLTDVVEPEMPQLAVRIEPATSGVRAGGNATSSAAKAKATPPDVPLLTEAVEAPEAAPLVAEAAPLIVEVEQGEPSFWLEVRDDDKSVLGVAPDSIAVVPPPDLRAQGGDKATQAVAAPSPVVSPPPAIATPQPVAAAPVAPAPGAAAPILESRPPIAEDIEIVEAAPPPEFEPEIVAQMALAAPATPVPPIPAHVAVDSARAAGSADEERWRQLAEDVRMQVLQRIDMFTDTGLHEQLGARLKPIVDRASADLVATINQHVGELLRSYVAEAIEREIERWRLDGER